MGRLKGFAIFSGKPTPTARYINSDSSPARFTEEGYLLDDPQLTRIGVFEYPDKPLGIRRQLRLPEEVFSPESLASYKGKPVIVTHDAGEVTAENVADEAIGAIMSEGKRVGDYVTAEIVIHETGKLKSGLRELSLGYSLDLDRTSGTWNGQPYDCIQRNTRINHLALVETARAGDKSRLNIDGQDTSKGESGMGKPKRQKNGDSDLDELVEAVVSVTEGEELHEGIVNDEEGEENPLDVALEAAAEETAEGAPEEGNKDEDPDTLEEALEIIKALKEKLAACVAQDGGEICEGEDEEPDERKTVNADSVDKIIAEKLLLIDIGQRMGVNVRNLGLRAAKQAIVRKGNPGMNCDGLSGQALNVAVAMTAKASPKATDRQRQQIFNRDGAQVPVSSAQAARQEMIERRNG